VSILLTIGTRPEAIKMAPIIHELQKRDIPFQILHSGQHHDHTLARQLIQELNIPQPAHTLQLTSDDPTRQMAEILTHTHKTLRKTKPRLLLVEGDTNTVLAASLAALRTDTPIAHIEAGLRSHDPRMPEEHNRRLVDHISTLLFAPTQTAANNLKSEDTQGTTHVTGNTVIDACLKHTRTQQTATSEPPRFQNYILATAHRAENVDDPQTLKEIAEALLESPLPIVLPLHPRTKKRLEELGLHQRLEESKNQVHLLPPLGYHPFLQLMKNSQLILTDSGGIQEEATAPTIRKRVLVMRNSTERPEAVEAGFARVVGTTKQGILQGIDEALDDDTPLPTASPYGDGKAGERITTILQTTLKEN